MSYGFHKHTSFEVIAAADAELGKPSIGKGKLQCNSTYFKNIGLAPTRLDLMAVAPDKLRSKLGLSDDQHIAVLATCPPCTGFSRANPENHLRDDKRNSLVRRSAQFAVSLSVDIVVMENARELIRGNFIWRAMDTTSLAGLTCYPDSVYPKFVSGQSLLPLNSIFRFIRWTVCGMAGVPRMKL